MVCLNDWHAKVLTPISQKTPVGEDCRLSESFERLQQEVSNDLSMDCGATDWQSVLSFSCEIMDTQSKDLLVLVYSIRAIVGVKGYEGLAESISVLSLYLKQYWRDGFPLLKRTRARRGALEWLSQQLADWVESNEPEANDRPHIETILALVPELNRKLAEFEGDWYLDFSSATRQLNGYLADLPGLSDAISNTGVIDDTPPLEGVDSNSEKPDREKIVPIRPSGSSDTSGKVIEQNGAPFAGTKSIATASESISDKKLLQQSLQQAQTSLRVLAKQRLVADIFDPTAYEISRFSTWLPIVELPQHQNNITPLRPVPMEKQAFFKTLFQQQQFTALIIEVENSLVSAPFWLDGHRMVIAALEAVENASENTNPHEALRKTKPAVEQIEKRVAEFISRLEGIEQLYFSDKTPFANAETLSWLDSIRPLTHQHNINERLSVLQDSTTVGCQDATLDRASIGNELTEQRQSSLNEQSLLNNANNIKRDSGFVAGLKALEQFCNESTCKHSWFRGRMITAQYCIDANEVFLAEQLLLQLDEITVSYQLESWEPALATEMLKMMLICKTRLKRQPESMPYYARLARINTIQCFEMNPQVEKSLI